ncbi:MAG: guanylate kinase [Eubacteriales bacterium]
MQAEKKVKDQGRLFVVSGPSGAGKGTICQALLQKKKDIELSISMTTRKPRSTEAEGINYYFVSEETFLLGIENGDLLEYAKVYGNYYGTPKQKVLDKLAEGKDVILEIDIQGAMKVREAYPEAIYVFILPPSMAELRKRITGRGTETESAISMRMNEALKEISYIDKYDYCVVNGDLEEAVNRVFAIITTEHCRVTESVLFMIKDYEEEL